MKLTLSSSPKDTLAEGGAVVCDISPWVQWSPWKLKQRLFQSHVGKRHELPCLKFGGALYRSCVLIDIFFYQQQLFCVLHS